MLDQTPLLSVEQEAQKYAADPNRWAVQLFRSIDTHSAYFEEYRHSPTSVRDTLVGLY